MRTTRKRKSALIERSSHELPESTLRHYYKKAYITWRARQRENAPSLSARERRRLPSHSCLTVLRERQCEIEQLPVRVYRTLDDRLHLCISGSDCPRRTTQHASLVYTLEDMFICKRTWKVHLCGPLCDGSYMDPTSRACVLPTVANFSSGFVDSDQVDRGRLLFYYKAGYVKWKTTLAKELQPLTTTQLKHHYCSVQAQDDALCRIAHVLVEIYAVPDEHGASGQHTCIAGHCEFARQHPPSWQKVAFLEDLYICEHTGKAHVCGQFCDGAYNVASASTESVCGISSIAHRDFAHRDPKTPIPGTQSTTRYRDVLARRKGTREKRDTILNDIEALSEACPQMNPLQPRKEIVEQLKLINPRLITLKQQYLHTGIYILSHIFSKDRFAADARAMRANERELGPLFDRYISSIGHSSDQMVGSDQLFMIAYQQTNKGYCAPDFTHLTDQQRRQLILRYATRCVALWYVVRKHTPEGQSNPDEIPWLDFVESALVILRSGVKFPSDCSYECVIIDKDKFLNMLPDTSAYLNDNQLGVAGTGGGGGQKLKRKSTTPMCTFIRTAMTDAVTKHGVNPHDFSIQRLNFVDFDDAQFVPLRGSSSSSTTTK